MTTHRRPPGGYLTSAQAAAILQVSSKTVQRWGKEGKLPYSRTLGGHRRYPEAKIRDLVAELTVGVGEVTR